MRHGLCLQDIQVGGDTEGQKSKAGNSLAVQWLGLHAFTARALGSIPGRGTKIPQATRRSQKKKEKKLQGSDLAHEGSYGLGDRAGRGGLQGTGPSPRIVNKARGNRLRARS